VLYGQVEQRVAGRELHHRVDAVVQTERDGVALTVTSLTPGSCANGAGSTGASNTRVTRLRRFSRSDSVVSSAARRDARTMATLSHTRSTRS